MFACVSCLCSQIVDLSADFRLRDVETYAKVGLHIALPRVAPRTSFVLRYSPHTPQKRCGGVLGRVHVMLMVNPTVDRISTEDTARLLAPCVYMDAAVKNMRKKN